MPATDRDRAKWALREDRTLSRNAAFVWLMLDTRGGDAFPSMATLAADCRMDERTLRKYLAELRAAGWLTVQDRQAPNGGQRTNRYILTAPPLHAVPPSPLHAVPPEDQRGRPTDHRGTANAVPLPALAEQETPMPRRKPAPADQPLPLVVGVAAPEPREPTARDVVRAYVDASRARHGHDPAARSIARVGRDAKRLLHQGIVAELLLEAATSLGQTPWDGLARQLDIISEGRRPPVVREVPLVDVEETVACEEVPGDQYEEVSALAYEEVV